MNEEMKGKFEQIKGKLKETWGRLTDDDIALADGKKDQFLGKLQEKYGLAKDEAEKRFNEITQSCSTHDKSCGCGTSDTENKG